MPLETFLVFTLGASGMPSGVSIDSRKEKEQGCGFPAPQLRCFGGGENMFLFLLITHFHKLCRENQPLIPSPLKSSLSISLNWLLHSVTLCPQLV